MSLDAAGDSRDNFGGILSSSDFSRNPQFIKCRLSSVSSDTFRRNSMESRPGHFPTIGLANREGQAKLISKKGYVLEVGD